MISTKQVTINYSDIGAEKAKMHIAKMIVLSFMAGMFIAFACTSASVVSSTVSNPSISRLLGALVFPAGLALVVANGTEVFTGNNLMIISVLDKKIKIRNMLRNWIVVYIGNFIGCILVTGMFSLGHVYSLFNNAVAKTVIETSVAKTSLTLSDAFIKGVFCNILVCVAVVMTMTTVHCAGKIASLFLPIMTFVICGLEHSIANMSYISAGIFAEMNYGDMGVDTSELSWFSFLVMNIVPVTLGNILGGCLTGAAYWCTSIKHE